MIDIFYEWIFPGRAAVLTGAGKAFSAGTGTTEGPVKRKKTSFINLTKIWTWILRDTGSESNHIKVKQQSQ